MLSISELENLCININFDKQISSSMASKVRPKGASDFEIYGIKVEANDAKNFYDYAKKNWKHLCDLEVENNCQSGKSVTHQLSLALLLIERHLNKEQTIKNKEKFITATNNISIFEVILNLYFGLMSSELIFLKYDKNREPIIKLFGTLLRSDKKLSTDVQNFQNTERLMDWTTQIIFASGDIQSAIEELWMSGLDNVIPWKIRSVWIEECCKQKFLDAFKDKAIKFSVQLNTETRKDIDTSIELAKRQGGIVIGDNDTSIPLIIGLTKQYIKSDNVITVNFFRTTKELVSLLKKDNVKSSLSLWSEKISLVYEVVNNLSAPNFWINCNGVFNENFPFSFRSNLFQFSENKLGEESANCKIINGKVFQCIENVKDAETKYKTVVIPFGVSFAN